MVDSYRDFLDSWATEIESRAKRVRNLIGDKHWLSDGQHKEYLIREFLARYLQSPIRVGHGFIHTHIPDVPCSPEIDVLITNSAKHPLFFDEGGLQVASVKSVRAAIEIKTTFSVPELTQALKRIAYVRYLLHEERVSDDVWLGAIFYQSKPGKCPISVLDKIEKIYKELTESTDWTSRLGKNAQICDPMVLTPTCICISGEIIVFFRTIDSVSQTVQVDIFKSESLSYALAIIDLIAVVKETREPTALELAYDDLGIQHEASRTIKIGASN